MKMEFWAVGKTSFGYLKDGIQTYEQRIKRYLPFQIQILPDIKVGKKVVPTQLKQKEGERILGQLKSGDFLILLDEKGRNFASVEFARFLEQQLQHSHKRIIFQIGGAYGFSDAVYARANAKLSLSKMTFSHQLIRVIFLEQLYRAFSIMNNEPYHNV